ncbi:MAG: hypothetical protein H7X70_03410 [Candidatus Kapabacteria bacterium]|nr:hypothetical protein [Candidatus Kapabacteria bacterium]
MNIYVHWQLRDVTSHPLKKLTNVGASVKHWPWKNILLISLGIVGFFVAVIMISYMVFSDSINESIRSSIAEYVRTRVVTGASSATKGKLEVDLGEINYTYYIGSLEVRDVKIRFRDTSDTAGRLVDVDVPRLTVTRLFAWDILLGKGLAVGTITLENPNVRHQKWGGLEVDTVLVPDTALVQLPHIPNVDSLLHRLLVDLLPNYAQPLVIKNINVFGATFTDTDVDVGQLYSSVMYGLTVKVGNINVDSARPDKRPIGWMEVTLDKWKRHYVDDRTIYLRKLSITVNEKDSSLSVDSIAFIQPNSYTFAGTGIVFSYRTRELIFGYFTLGPTREDAEHFAAQKFKTDRFRIRGDSVHLRDIDFGALTDRTALHVRKIDMASLSLDILSNKRLGSNPKAGKPKMPNELISSIPFILHVDSISVFSAKILYGERWAHSAKPAELSWSGVRILALNLSNTADQIEKPFSLWAKGTFVGQSEMEARFVIPLTAPVYTLKATGSLGRLDMTVLNSFLPIADNVRIKSGVTSSARFSFSIKGRSCIGVVEPHYMNLNLALVDGRTKETGFLKGLFSFIANWLVIKNDNDGKDYAAGPINFTLPKDAAIMQTIWFPIRSGIKKAAGL